MYFLSKNEHNLYLEDKGKKMDRDFQISSVTTPATESLIDAEFLEEWMNQQFKLEKYGPGLEQLFILFTITENPQEPYSRYHPDDSMLETVVPVTESQLTPLDQEAVLPLLLSQAANALLLLPPQLVPAFNLSALVSDLEGLEE